MDIVVSKHVCGRDNYTKRRTFLCFFSSYLTRRSTRSRANVQRRARRYFRQAFFTQKTRLAELCG